MDLVFGNARGTHWTRILTSDEQAAWLAELLQKQPKDMALYQRALTHGSTGQPDYQRLEFLGDRIARVVRGPAGGARDREERREHGTRRKHRKAVHGALLRCPHPAP